MKQVCYRCTKMFDISNLSTERKKTEYSISPHLRKYLQENHMSKQRKTGLGIEASHFKMGSHPKGLD